MTGIIAVHVGAGSHSTSLQDSYKKIMRKACKDAINVLKDGGAAIDAVCLATQTLENSSLTNAGFGSSLSIEGNVECDASVMDGKSLHHGCVGAVSGIKNPVTLAQKILVSQKVHLTGGLIPPSFLTGPGAKLWAESHDVEICNNEVLISDKSRKMHEYSLGYIKNLDERQEKRRKYNQQVCPEEEELEKTLLDTVGAVCIDMEGNSASAVSSGGLLLKQSGRVGQAAVYGCGCWSQNNYEGSNCNIAVSTSGCGEHLIRTNFARLCAKATVFTDPLGNSLSQCINSKFLNSPFLEGISSKMAGSICLRYDPSNSLSDLFWLHTTRTMGIAYMAVDSIHPQAIFTELDEGRVGKTSSVNCKSFYVKNSSQRILD